jgi:hypothetical protein
MRTKTSISNIQTVILSSVPSLFDELLGSDNWPTDEIPESDGQMLKLIRALHFFNTSLWNEEDLARRTKVGDAEIAKNKRAIDRFNQSRNDHIEKIDDLIIAALASVKRAEMAYRSSETPGSMIDRISILSLKIFHTNKQLARSDIDDDHRRICLNRAATLSEQRVDLTDCLVTLVREASVGGMYFKVYRQYKMYNDRKFNPALVAENS